MWIDKNRCKSPGDQLPCIALSRFRKGKWLFSAQLFRSKPTQASISPNCCRNNLTWFEHRNLLHGIPLVIITVILFSHNGPSASFSGEKVSTNLGQLARLYGPHCESGPFAGYWLHHGIKSAESCGLGSSKLYHSHPESSIIFKNFSDIRSFLTRQGLPALFTKESSIEDAAFRPRYTIHHE